MSTFSIRIDDAETGEYITTHILDEENLDEVELYVDRDRVLTIEEIDLDEWK